MFLERLVAFPESRRVLRLHLMAHPLLAVLHALLPMLPILLRKEFDATATQVMIATQAVPLLMGLSILWNEIYRRVNPGTYLLGTWLLAALPLAMIRFCHGPSSLLFFMILTAVGIAGGMPLNADILRSCYPPNARSKVFATLNASGMVVVMMTTYGVGKWLDHDSESFRYYLPLGSAVVITGIVIFHRITRQPLFTERHQHVNIESFGSSIKRIFHNALVVFRENPHFRQYEIAFFIYGTGWMICEALRPLLVTDVLRMEYDDIAASTQSAFQLTLLLMIVPAGIVMDRVGPVRVAAFAFAGLVIYPILLIFASGKWDLTIATVVFGASISCVHLAWTIGPLTLARNASQAPYYLAIHATLVGVRALVGQPLGVALYKLTDNIYIPLGLAAGFFLVGSIVMWVLDRDLKAEERKPAPPETNPRIAP